MFQQEADLIEVETNHEVSRAANLGFMVFYVFSIWKSSQVVLSSKNIAVIQGLLSFHLPYLHIKKTDATNYKLLEHII